MAKVQGGLTAAQQAQFQNALDHAHPANRAAFEKAVTIIAASDGNPAVNKGELAILKVVAMELSQPGDVSGQIESFAKKMAGHLTKASDQHFGLAFQGDPKTTEKWSYVHTIGTLYIDTISNQSHAKVTQAWAGEMAFSKLGDGLSHLSLKREESRPNLVEVDRAFFASSGTVVAYREAGRNNAVLEELTLADVANQKRNGDKIEVEFLPGRSLKSMSVDTSTGHVTYTEAKSGLGKLTAKNHAEGYIAKGGDGFEVE